MSKIVIIESPYAGEVAENITYARRCLADSLRRGEAPFASHLLYTQEGVLDDTNPDERRMGMDAGFSFRTAETLTAVYVDRGLSKGMEAGILDAFRKRSPIEFRRLERPSRGFVARWKSDGCYLAAHGNFQRFNSTSINLATVFGSKKDVIAYLGVQDHCDDGYEIVELT